MTAPSKHPGQHRYPDRMFEPNAYAITDSVSPDTTPVRGYYTTHDAGHLPLEGQMPIGTAHGIDYPPDRNAGQGILYAPPPRNAETVGQQARTQDESRLHRLADLTNKQDRLPKMKPEVFSGDILKFPIWWNSFQALTEGKADVASERLFFLGKYTNGDARASIQGYLTLYTDEADTQARAMLLSRYGDKVKVAKAYKKKLDEWPMLRPQDGEGLQKYADFLWPCNAAISSISYLSSLDSAEEYKRMARKLPYYIADRWRRVGDRHLYNEEQNPHAPQSGGYYPGFAEFCKFVSGEARIACGPCNTRSMVSRTNDKPSKPGKAGTFATQSNTVKSPSDKKQPKKDYNLKCTFCKAAHPVANCESFLKQDTETKKAFALRNGLCFGCLRRNHQYRDCRSRTPKLMEGKQEVAATQKAQPVKKDEGKHTSTAAATVNHSQDINGLWRGSPSFHDTPRDAVTPR